MSSPSPVNLIYLFYLWYNSFNKQYTKPSNRFQIGVLYGCVKWKIHKAIAYKFISSHWNRLCVAAQQTITLARDAHIDDWVKSRMRIELIWMRWVCSTFLSILQLDHVPNNRQTNLFVSTGTKAQQIWMDWAYSGLTCCRILIFIILFLFFISLFLFSYMITVAIDKSTNRQRKRYLTTCSTATHRRRWDLNRQLAHLSIGLRWGAIEFACLTCYPSTIYMPNLAAGLICIHRACKSISIGLKLLLLTSYLCIWPWMMLIVRVAFSIYVDMCELLGILVCMCSDLNKASTVSFIST